MNHRMCLFKINQSGYFDGTGWRKRNNGSLNGIADLIGSINGRPIACEVKKPGEEPSEEQYAFLRHTRKMGWISCWVVSLQEFKDVLFLEKFRPIE